MLYFNQSDNINRSKIFAFLFFPDPCITHKQPVINMSTATLSFETISG